MPAKHAVSFGQARRWARALRHWRLLPNTFTIMVNATAFQHAQLEPFRFGACQTLPRRDGFLGQMMMFDHLGSLRRSIQAACCKESRYLVGVLRVTGVTSPVKYHRRSWCFGSRRWVGESVLDIVGFFCGHCCFYIQSSKSTLYPRRAHSTISWGQGGSAQTRSTRSLGMGHCVMEKETDSNYGAQEAAGVAAHPTESLGLAGGAALKF